MVTIIGDSLNELAYKTFDQIFKKGSTIDSRNGECIELLDSDLYLTNPRARHLYLPGRTSNIFASIAETFWVLAGREELDPLMTFFLPRSKNYSDDGKTWRGAYGPRIYTNSQIEHIIDMFDIGGLSARQAAMTIWRPDMDTKSAMKKEGYDSTIDMPCSQWLGFFIRDNKLNLKLQMRSNDCVYGMTGINIFEFTFLQEIILELLKSNLDYRFQDIELGYYHHSVISLHIYENSTKNQVKNVLSHKLNNKNYSLNKMSLPKAFPYSNFILFFNEVYDYFCSLIKECEFTDLEEIFKDHFKINIINNQLYHYALAVENYIRNKQGRNLIPYPDDMSADFRKAIKL